MDAEGCPRCSGTCHGGLSNGKRRYATCRYDWRPGRLPLYLTKRLWRQMLRWFPRGLNAGRVARVTLASRRVLTRKEPTPSQGFRRG